MNWIDKEIEGVHLPDERYRKNLGLIGESLSEHYDLSFSRALGDKLRKSAWRLFSSGDLDLLSTHRQTSLARCENHEVILAVEDTTDIVYHQAQQQGLGRLGGCNKGQAYGLCMHSNLLLTEQGECLGIFHQKIWSPKPANRLIHHNKLPITAKESHKWFASLKAFQDLGTLLNQQIFIKIADREADIYELYQSIKSSNLHLLIRAKHLQRIVLYEGKKTNLAKVLKQLIPQGSGEVQVQRKANQASRLAQVQYYATPLTLCAPNRLAKSQVELNLIWVKEDAPRKDALEWVLLTNLAVHNLSDICRIVGYYTKRWVIERFHLILKSGLNIEKIQIKQADNLCNALQLYSLVAWHLLAIKQLGLQNSQEPAETYFENESIEVLQTYTQQNIKTVNDYILQLASLVGFKPNKQQPHPGEKTLWLAIHKFIIIQKAFVITKQKYGTG